MGFLNTIGTILPTIGNILGKLLTGNKSSGGLTASSTVPYNFGDDIVCGFKRDSAGEIKLLNSSMDDNKVVTLSVPAIGDMEAETVIVPSECGAPVTEIFERCADADSTKCMLSGSSVDPTALASNEANDAFHFAAGGRNIPADGVTSRRIGSFLKVICSLDKAVFESARSIKTITSATFYGCNDSSVTLTNIDAEKNGAGTKVEVLFPTPFPEGSYLDVDVEVDMGDLNQLVAEQRIRLFKASESDLQEVRTLAMAIRR